jgi:hypothetical protein
VTVTEAALLVLWIVSSAACYKLGRADERLKTEEETTFRRLDAVIAKLKSEER